MNKFAVLAALFGLVALATCAPVDLEGEGEEFSELQIKPDDGKESAYLSERHTIFDDYCKTSRDHVYSYISDKNKEVVANIFATFFGSINDVTKQLESIQIAEAEKATKAIMEGTAEAPAEEGDETEKSAGLLKSVGSAVKAYVTALGQAAMQEVLTRITLLKMTASVDNFKDLLVQTCTGIQLKLIPELQAMFKETKANIAGNNPTPETANMLAGATFENVKCLTASRANKVVNVCRVLNTAGPMIFTMMGI